MSALKESSLIWVDQEGLKTDGFDQVISMKGGKIIAQRSGDGTHTKIVKDLSIKDASFNVSDEINVLRTVPLLADLSPETLKLIAFSSERHNLVAGDVLFNSGDTSNGAYIVLSGQLEVSIDKDGSKKVPVMLHRALFGSLERFIGILIENYAGKLPFWITPLQTVVIPISNDFDDYAKNVHQQLKKAGISSEVDLKNHNLNYKIRDHSLTKVPLLLICGKKEVDTNSVTIRRLDSNKQENMKLNEFLKKYSAFNKAPSI